MDTKASPCSPLSAVTARMLEEGATAWWARWIPRHISALTTAFMSKIKIQQSSSALPLGTCKWSAPRMNFKDLVNHRWMDLINHQWKGLTNHQWKELRLQQEVLDPEATWPEYLIALIHPTP